MARSGGTRLAELDPLIVTAAFDAGAAETLQRLRDRHFPARLNIVPAHLTLFHHLPGGALDDVVATLRARCDACPAVSFASAGLRFLGRGVAVEIDAPYLVSLRRHLAVSWQDWLTPQDRQGFKPHVTVQNKADPAEARALLAHLRGEGLTLLGRITGLRLWHYRGGPWDEAGVFPFGG